jgi:hypothetical protein
MWYQFSRPSVSGAFEGVNLFEFAECLSNKTLEQDFSFKTAFCSEKMGLIKKLIGNSIADTLSFDSEVLSYDDFSKYSDMHRQFLFCLRVG